MKDCIFCQIAAHQIPTQIVTETASVIAFHDISKDAKTHILIIPKKHLASLNDATDKNKDLLGEIILTAAKIAQQAGIDQSGYRLVTNTNKHAGQVISHLHFHLLGGEPLGPLIVKKAKT